MVDEKDYLELAEQCLGSQFNKERWVSFLNDEPEKSRKQINDLAVFKRMPLLSTEPVESVKPKKVKSSHSVRDIPGGMK